MRRMEQFPTMPSIGIRGSKEKDDFAGTVKKHKDKLIKTAKSNKFKRRICCFYLFGKKFQKDYRTDVIIFVSFIFGRL